MKLKLCKASLMLIAMQALSIPMVFDVMGMTMKGVFGVVVFVLMGLQATA